MGWGGGWEGRRAQSHTAERRTVASSPSELPAAVNFALANEVSSVALMTLGQLYLDQGDHDVAKTALIQALDRQSIDAATLAGLRFRLGRAYLGWTQLFVVGRNGVSLSISAFSVRVWIHTRPLPLNFITSPSPPAMSEPSPPTFPIE